jgi:hypothetical protein
VLHIGSFCCIAGAFLEYHKPRNASVKLSILDVHASNIVSDSEKARHNNKQIIWTAKLLL